MAKGQKRKPEQQADSNNNAVSQVAKQMRTSGADTKTILKTLMLAELRAKFGNISLSDANIGKLISEGSIMQSTKDSVNAAEERSNHVISDVGDTGQLMRAIVEKDETALSGDNIDDLNHLIEVTNNKSSKMFDIKQTATERIESGITSRDELLQAVKDGKLSESDFSQKLSEKLEDTKIFAKDIEQKAEAAATDIERDLPRNDRLHQEVQAIGFAKRVLKAPGLSDTGHIAGPSETTQEGPAQDSGGGSSITPG